MKKAFLSMTIFTIFLLSACTAIAVVPQKLKYSESHDYKKVNKVTETVFKNLKDEIDVSEYSPYYQNYRLMFYENTQLPGFYYVKAKDAELLYDKNTKALKFITFRTKTSPRAWIVYSYPSGKLRQVDVWVYLNEIHSFNSDGVYIDTKKFAKEAEKSIRDNWNLSNWSKFKYALLGKSNPPVIVLLTINYQGVLEQCKALSQSKSEEYNNSIYDAIWKTTPFKANYPFTTRTVNVKIKF